MLFFTFVISSFHSAVAGRWLYGGDVLTSLLTYEQSAGNDILEGVINRPIESYVGRQYLEHFINRYKIKCKSQVKWRCCSAMLCEAASKEGSQGMNSPQWFWPWSSHIWRFFNVWSEDEEDEFHTGALVQTWASTSCLDTDNRVNSTVNRWLYVHLYVSICIVSIREECLNSDRSMQSLFSLNSLNIVLLNQHVQVEIISSYSVDKAHSSFMIHDYLSFYYKMQDVVFIWDSQKK